MEADAEPHGAPVVGGELAHAFDAVGDHRRRFAPRQVDVGAGGGDHLGGLGRPTEVDLGLRGGLLVGGGRLDPVVRALVIERLGAPGAPHDLDELTGAGVPGVLVGVVAEAGELVGLVPVTRLTITRPPDRRW